MTIDEIATLARAIYPRPPRDEARGHDPEIEAEHLTGDDGTHLVVLHHLPGGMARVVARAWSERKALERAHATLTFEARGQLARAQHTAAMLSRLLAPEGDR